MRYHIKAMNVFDANVMLSGLRSSNGASHVIVREMISGNVPFAISPAIALEYEDVLKRPGILGENPWIANEEIEVVLDAVFKRAKLVSPWFRFRPFLNDPKDDLYIECALAAGARTIVTSDRHFDIRAVGDFGISIIKVGPFVAEFRKRNQPS
jgi:putative PIN family toxin of toxin-antitoxin system